MAVDISKVALQTYATNIGLHTLEFDLCEDTNFPQATLVVGGPSCQGFSSAGMRRKNDHRNSLVAYFAQIVAHLRPRAFVFENVKGFLTAEREDRVIELLTSLIAAGYCIYLRKINAANYGIPQHRKRVIAIGGLDWRPSFPTPIHTAYGAPGARNAACGRPFALTIADALATLPAPTTEPPGYPQGHFYRPLRGIDLERAIALKPGQTMRDLPRELQHRSFQRRAFRRVMNCTPTAHRGGAPSGVKRLKPDEPSKAITGAPRLNFIPTVADGVSPRSNM